MEAVSITNPRVEYKRALLMIGLGLGALINLWVLWIFVNGCLGRLPFDAYPNMPMSAWLKAQAELLWIDKPALHIDLSNKITFTVLNIGFLISLPKLYSHQTKRLIWLIVGVVLLNVLLLFSPSIGTL